jgi:hypothetical protein
MVECREQGAEVNDVAKQKWSKFWKRFWITVLVIFILLIIEELLLGWYIVRLNAHRHHNPTIQFPISN